jgi:hypothetical protein
MIKSPAKEGPANTNPREGGDLDAFAKAHDRYHEAASGITATYWSQTQTAYREYLNAVEAAQTVRDPELRREALQVATEKYGLDCRKALEVADRDSEELYRDYVKDLKEAWNSADVQNTTTGDVAAIAQAMMRVALRASGACV